MQVNTILIFFIVAFPVSLIGFLAYPNSGQTQPNISFHQDSSTSRSNSDPRNPGGGLAQNPLPLQRSPGGEPTQNQNPPSGKRRPGGGLGESGSCRNTNKPLTALVPLNNEQRLTITEYPTFWFYIPYTPEEVQSIEFSLYNRAEDVIYRTSFQLSQTPGIIGIRLPATAKYALKPNEYYHWYLTIQCPGNTTAVPDLYVEEWVQRVPFASERERQINAGMPDVWYDSLTRLANLRLASPQEKQLKRDWINLLKSAELEELAEEPLLNSIQLPDK